MGRLGNPSRVRRPTRLQGHRWRVPTGRRASRTPVCRVATGIWAGHLLDDFDEIAIDALLQESLDSSVAKCRVPIHLEVLVQDACGKGDLVIGEIRHNQPYAVLFRHSARFRCHVFYRCRTFPNGDIIRHSAVDSDLCRITTTNFIVVRHYGCRYDCHRVPTRGAEILGPALRRRPGGGHDQPMTDSNHAPGAQNPDARRPTNGHTITGDPHRDAGIDWDRVRREVGE